MPREQKSPMKLILIIIAALVVVLVIAGCLFMFKSKIMDSGDTGIKADQYQAVFLTNGQVYFGKASVSKDVVKLTDIYYLQVQQSVQPADKDKNAESQVSLAKLGDELHGPDDAMYISRDQVLFWENMKDGSKVVQAIKGNKK